MKGDYGLFLDLNQLKLIRKKRGISQSEMAQLMGWKNRSAYAKRENGFVSIGADELIKMAEILGVEDNIQIFFTK